MVGEEWNWVFRCYCRPSNGRQGADVIEEWYWLQDDEVRANIDTILEFLQNRPRVEWRRPYFDLLGGKHCKGLGEVRIRAASGAYRILGFFGPERQKFTLLIGFKKKSKSDTDHACKIAQSRRKEVENDNTRSRECNFP